MVNKDHPIVSRDLKTQQDLSSSFRTFNCEKTALTYSGQQQHDNFDEIFQVKVKLRKYLMEDCYSELCQ